MSEPVAILIADIHLSHLPPKARQEEPDWYEAMRNILKDVVELSYDLSPCLGKLLPVICAGDIFDKWNPPIELINFAMSELPIMNAVPGQHDLPQHNYDNRHRCGYTTLEKGGVITNLPPTKTTLIGDHLRLVGFPWGFNIEPCKAAKDHINVAVIHHYCWNAKRTKFKGAPRKDRLIHFRKALEGFDVAVFGDNHIPFEGLCGTTRVFNCGSLFRRHSDEIKHNPSVGILHDDKTIRRHCLDISKDTIKKTVKVEAEVIDAMADVVQSLCNVSPDSLQIKKEVRRYLKTNDVSKRTKAILMEAFGL